MLCYKEKKLDLVSAFNITNAYLLVCVWKINITNEIVDACKQTSLQILEGSVAWTCHSFVDWVDIRCMLLDLLHQFYISLCFHDHTSIGMDNIPLLLASCVVWVIGAHCGELQNCCLGFAMGPQKQPPLCPVSSTMQQLAEGQQKVTFSFWLYI